MQISKLQLPEQEMCYVNDVRFQRRRTQTVASAGND